MNDKYMTTKTRQEKSSQRSDMAVDKQEKSSQRSDMVADKPDWFHVAFNPEKTKRVNQLMQQLQLNTVCQSANCPNLGECFQRGTATFMVLGNICTHKCPYCNIDFGKPQPVDPQEPYNLAQAAKEMALKHVVVTSVCRDDLQDGGAEHFAQVIEAVHQICEDTTVEVLIPDFKGKQEYLNKVLQVKPEVLNHNVETVKELYKTVRPQGNYLQTLQILKNTSEYAKSQSDGLPLVKTGVMLGLGETVEQLSNLFDDLIQAGCEILTLGQYLRPTPKHLKVERYIKPSEFEEYKQLALSKGFKYVSSGPLVRSSYRAETALAQIKTKANEKTKRS